jgi:hypothetical protein
LNSLLHKKGFKLSAYLTAANTMRTTRILSVKTESSTVKTFTVKDKLCAKAKPGQLNVEQKVFHFLLRVPRAMIFGDNVVRHWCLGAHG